jgi:hypothetical protein
MTRRAAPVTLSLKQHETKAVNGGAERPTQRMSFGPAKARAPLSKPRVSEMATTLATLVQNGFLAAARSDAKRGRGAQPPAGTRVWVGAAPSDSLLCPICIDVFQQARFGQQAAARRSAWARLADSRRC